MHLILRCKDIDLSGIRLMMVGEFWRKRTRFLEVVGHLWTDEIRISNCSRWPSEVLPPVWTGRFRRHPRRARRGASAFYWLGQPDLPGGGLGAQDGATVARMVTAAQ